ncbi:MAG TPA: YraN family protein [Polyangiaceae bacterium]|nr:YraN family protein [Polyangiaceae bacterium]
MGKRVATKDLGKLADSAAELGQLRHAKANPELNLQRQRERSAAGKAAELAVVDWLVERGYTIVARNVRMGRYEIDIVAQLGPVIAVVEVRFRGTRAWTSGFGSIDPAKRLRIRRAGERLWSRHYRNNPAVERLRFDAASVHFSGDQAEVTYVIAAF